MRMRAAVLKREIMVYRFQFSINKPARQTKIPAMLTHETLSSEDKDRNREQDERCDRVDKNRGNAQIPAGAIGEQKTELDAHNRE